MPSTNVYRSSSPITGRGCFVERSVVTVIDGSSSRSGRTQRQRPQLEPRSTASPLGVEFMALLESDSIAIERFDGVD